MKRSQLIAAMLAIEIPGTDDPEVDFINPQMRVSEPINTVYLDRRRNEPHIVLDYDYSLEQVVVEKPKPKSLAQRESEHRQRDTSIGYKLVFSSLRSYIHNVLSEFLFEQLNNVVLSKMNASIQQVFANDAIDNTSHVVADGLQVIGGKARSDPSKVGSVCVQWELAFYPRARWKQEAENATPLGFHGKYDLYLVYQSSFGLPPTFIARYGDLPHQYDSFNAILFDTANYEIDNFLINIDEHFLAALDRATFLGIDLRSNKQ